MIRVACVQTASGTDVEANLTAAAADVRRAGEEGATLIALPECVAYRSGDSGVRAVARPDADNPMLDGLRALAAETSVWLLVGSLPVLADDGRIWNRSYLLDDGGAVRAHYDKIHMFDVDLAGEERHRESAVYRPGERAVVVPTPFGRIGMTVCYDVRFPQLYRALAKAGADILTVPANFTEQTGRAHWHVLLRARAIETGCYVVAPAQAGTYGNGRRSFGHSLVVGPWGEILADGGDEVGVVLAEIEPTRVAAARAMVPSLTHDRPFDAPEPARDQAVRRTGS